MSEVNYTVAPDPDNYSYRTLWRHDGTAHPPVIALADVDGDYQDVFWAAAAVLAPNDEVRRLIRMAISDPGWHTPREHRTDGGFESIPNWGMRAVLAALREHATGGER